MSALGAVTFFSLSLLCSTFYAARDSAVMRFELAAMTIVTICIVCLYAGLIAVFRLSPDYEPGPKVWVASCVLLVVSVGVSYHMANLDRLSAEAATRGRG